MNLGYLDTSCLVAIAFDEPDSLDLARLLAEPDRLVSSNLLEAEFRSALARERVRGGEDLLSWVTWLLPDRPLSDEVRRVLEHGYLRGADLWHLSCALLLRSEVPVSAFLSLDERQRQVARALGFTVAP